MRVPTHLPWLGFNCSRPDRPQWGSLRHGEGPQHHTNTIRAALLPSCPRTRARRPESQNAELLRVSICPLRPTPSGSSLTPAHSQPRGLCQGWGPPGYPVHCSFQVSEGGAPWPPPVWEAVSSPEQPRPLCPTRAAVSSAQAPQGSYLKHRSLHLGCRSKVLPIKLDGEHFLPYFPTCLKY